MPGSVERSQRQSKPSKAWSKAGRKEPGHLSCLQGHYLRMSLQHPIPKVYSATLKTVLKMHTYMHTHMHTHILPTPLQILSSQTMAHTEIHTHAYKTSKSGPGQNNPVLLWVDDILWFFKMQGEERESDISVASLPAASESSIMSKHKRGEYGYKRMTNVLKKSVPRFSSGRWLNRARGQAGYVACFCCLLNTAHRPHPRICQKLAHNMGCSQNPRELFSPILRNWASWRVIWSCQLPCEFVHSGSY